MDEREVPVMDKARICPSTILCSRLLSSSIFPQSFFMGESSARNLVNNPSAAIVDWSMCWAKWDDRMWRRKVWLINSNSHVRWFTWGSETHDIAQTQILQGDLMKKNWLWAYCGHWQMMDVIKQCARCPRDRCVSSGIMLMGAKEELGWQLVSWRLWSSSRITLNQQVKGSGYIRGSRYTHYCVPRHLEHLIYPWDLPDILYRRL